MRLVWTAETENLKYIIDLPLFIIDLQGPFRTPIWIMVSQTSGVALYLELMSSSSSTVNEGCGISRYYIENDVASISHLQKVNKMMNWTARQKISHDITY
jgi:hypothetical protein